jgi:hypothetical protein
LFLSLEFNEEMQQIKFTCHTYKFDHFGDLNELFTTNTEAELQGEIDGKKVKYILKGTWGKLDRREISNLLNEDNSINEFNQYFTFRRETLFVKNKIFITTQQPRDSLTLTNGYGDSDESDYYYSDDDDY